MASIFHLPSWAYRTLLPINSDLPGLNPVSRRNSDDRRDIPASIGINTRAVHTFGAVGRASASRADGRGFAVPCLRSKRPQVWTISLSVNLHGGQRAGGCAFYSLDHPSIQGVTKLGDRVHHYQSAPLPSGGTRSATHLRELRTDVRMTELPTPPAYTYIGFSRCRKKAGKYTTNALE